MRKLLCFLTLLALLLAGCGTQKPETTPPVTLVPPPLTFTVHFLDVGQADAILLECGGEFALIDAGNVADGSYVVSYLEKAGVEKLSALISTHPHEDHAGGLAAVLAVYPTEAVYAATTTYDTKCYNDFLHYADQQRLTVQIPKAGDRLMLGEASITVLGPVKRYANTNDTSLVLMVQFGENRFLFTGDMEMEAETDLIESGADLKADVLKVGHHGSSTSTGYRFLYEVDPTYAVISVGKDNDYGHPHDEPMSRLRDADVTVYRTDEMGAILAVSDGKTVTFSWENPSAVPNDPTVPVTHYIGNRNSKVLHLPSCSGLPAEQNRIVFDSYEDAIAAGYKPCSRCMS